MAGRARAQVLVLEARVGSSRAGASAAAQKRAEVAEVAEVAVAQAQAQTPAEAPAEAQAEEPAEAPAEAQEPGRQLQRVLLPRPAPELPLALAPAPERLDETASLSAYVQAVARVLRVAAARALCRRTGRYRLRRQALASPRPCPAVVGG